MKRIFLSSTTRSSIDQLAKNLAEVLAKALGGIEIKFIEGDDYHGLIEFNDENDPIDCAYLREAIYTKLGLDLSEVNVSVFNYKPEVTLGFNFVKKSSTEFEKNIDKILKLKDELEGALFGQSHAINVVIDGLIKAYSFANTPKDRPFASFILAGASHTGKTTLATMVANGLGLPAMAFGYQEYLKGELVLSALNQLMVTGKRAVVIFNEFEKIDMRLLTNLAYINQAGEVGPFTFKNLILFFVTSAGSEVYRRANFFDYAGVTSKEVVSALAEERDEEGRPIFPEFLLNALTIDAAVIFNNLTPYVRELIVANHVENYVKDLNANSNLNLITNPYMLANYALFANPSVDDVSVLNNYIDDLLNQQVAFLAKQFNEEGRLLNSIKDIVVELNSKGATKQVMDLFAVNQRRGLIVAKEQDSELLKGLAIDKVDLVILSKVDEAIKELKEGGFDFIFVDPTLEASENSLALLDVEDYESEGMRLFSYATRYHNNIPLYILVNYQEMLPPSRYDHLLSLGAKGYAGFANDDLEDIKNAISFLAVDVELRNDIEYLKEEKLRLVSNPKQAIVKNEEGKSALMVSLQKMELVPVEMSIEEIREDELRHIKTMDDIIGNDIAKKVLRDAGEYLSNTQEFIASGALPNKMILLTGRRATGKTALVKVLARETRADLIRFDCKKVLFDSGEHHPFKVIKTLFSHARKMAPAIVHIENIFFLFSPEIVGGFGAEKLIDILNEELTICQKNTLRPILVIAEAGGEELKYVHPKFGDLISRIVRTEYHKLEEVEEYLRRLLARKNITTLTEKGIRNLSQRCIFYNYRTINDMINFVLLQSKGKEITDNFMADTIDLYNYGDETKFKNEEERLAVAYHEMGHYLLMRLFGQKSAFVTIVSRGNYGGYTLNASDEMPRSKRDFLNEICVCFGGRAAEVILRGEDEGINSGIFGDIQVATNMAFIMVTMVAMGETLSFYNESESTLMSNVKVHEQMDKILAQEYERSMHLLQLNKENLDILAKALYEKRYMMGEDMEALLPDEKLIKE